MITLPGLGRRPTISGFEIEQSGRDPGIAAK